MGIGQNLFFRDTDCKTLRRICVSYMDRAKKLYDARPVCSDMANPWACLPCLIADSECSEALISVRLFPISSLFGWATNFSLFNTKNPYPISRGFMLEMRDSKEVIFMLTPVVPVNLPSHKIRQPQHCLDFISGSLSPDVTKDIFPVSFFGNLIPGLVKAIVVNYLYITIVPPAIRRTPLFL